MKVFISWSGKFSQEVANLLSDWIPTVLQHVTVFYSPDDIEKGENWDQKISKELSESKYGLICLTPQNVAAPWIHFEGGALAKSLDSRVSALMLNVTPSDIKGPLSRYQNTNFTREDMFKLIQSINSSSTGGPVEKVLERTFEGLWGELERGIKSIVERYSIQTTNTKIEKDPTTSAAESAIEEVLRLVRKIDSSMSSATIANILLSNKNQERLYEEQYRNQYYSSENDVFSRNIFKIAVSYAVKAEELLIKDIINNYGISPKMVRENNSNHIVAIVRDADTAKKIMFDFEAKKFDATMVELT